MTEQEYKDLGLPTAAEFRANSAYSCLNSIAKDSYFGGAMWMRRVAAEVIAKERKSNLKALAKILGKERRHSLKVIADIKNYLYVLQNAISFSDPIDDERIAAKAQLELLEILIAKIEKEDKQ